MSKYCVYKHTSPSGKVYIGITSQNPIRRWKNGFGYKTQNCFFNAIKKYSWDNIKHEILFTGLSKDEAEQKEIELIDYYKSNVPIFGYNIKEGGCCFNEFSIETRLKISKNRKGKCYGEQNPFFGKHHSEENKKRQSELMKGNSYFKNHHHSDEFKKMKSEQMKIKYANGNHKNKIVIQYDLQGKFISKYRSLRFCSQKLGFPIASLSQAIKNNKPYKNYMFAYEG